MYSRFVSMSQPQLGRIRAARVLIALVPVLLALGCADDSATAPPPPVTDPARIYWALTLDHHAVTMSTAAPYDTIRLTATPRTLDGTPLDGLPAPTFRSLDLDRIVVGDDGLVHAIKAGSAIPVEASLTVGNLRHADTVYFNVTDATDPPVLASLSIQPEAGDSAKIPFTAHKNIPAHALAADGSAIPGLVVYYTTLEHDVATIEPVTGILRPVRPGHVTVIATATAYGITRADTLRYTITYPIQAELDIVAQVDENGRTIGGFNRPLLFVSPGARLFIFNQTSIATDVTFDDPTNVAADEDFCVPPYTTVAPYLCASGNVEAFAKDPADVTGTSMFRIRRFPVPGTYTYHSTIFGTSGKIVVIDDSSLP